MNHTQQQQIFTHAIETLNRHGRASQDGITCNYFPTYNDHPGCAIGCQPGFREEFGWSAEFEGQAIYALLHDHERVREFFGVENDDDKSFLCSLQVLHDTPTNWDGGRLASGKVFDFAVQHGLKVPA